MNVRWGMVLVLLLGAAGPTRGADFIAVEDECNGRNLLIQGPIERGDDARFLDFMAELVAGGDLPAVQDPDVLWTVDLDSPGGDLDAAMGIGRFLRQAFATTEVGYRYARRPDGVWDFARAADLVCLDGRDRLAGCHRDLVEAECTGACLLVWLGGASRHANEGRLGLHGLRADAAAPGALADYLEAMAVPAPWVERVLGGGAAGAPADGDGWLDWPARHALAGRAPALRALIADCPPPLTREESFQSIAAPSAALRDALMDRADAHRSCRREGLAAARAELVARLERRR